MEQTNLFPCPSCGFLMFSIQDGSYEICSICDWEDDSVQARYPGMGGGANKDSLKEYQDRILKIIPANIMEYKGEKRDPKWRPLRDNEVITAEKGTGINYFNAIDEEPLIHYWLKDRHD